jgi:hypothetical protein
MGEGEGRDGHPSRDVGLASDRAILGIVSSLAFVSKPD